MGRHPYRQYCALARALDVVGDRWVLLIVRELRPGPRRFTDLAGGLPGISRKVLTERLRSLEDAGVVARRQLPPPAARQVYELTGEGRDLAGAMAPLIAWGARRIGERGPGEAFRPRWVATAMAGLADRAAARGVHDVYQYVVGDSAWHFVVEDGAVDVRDGRAEDPDVVVTTDEATWAAIASGATTAADAAADGALTLTGDGAAVRRLGKVFSRERMLDPSKAPVQW